MKRPSGSTTVLFLPALVCFAFGFVPLLIVALETVIESVWLFISETPSMTVAVDRAFHDWASLYVTDGQYDMRLFAAQCACALLWVAYVKWAGSKLSAASPAR
jgi:hypothetical protein